jgi:uncharacterized protein YjbJ (UPF0337 family)
MPQDGRRGFESMWPDVRDRLRQQWQRLTDEDIERIEGKRDSLLEKLQERYGLTYERIDRQVADFEVDVAHAARRSPSPLGIGNDWS